ncbi:MAG: DUF4105 domain-containing protein [Bacteroidales bacterium]|nr:DUF4105 domain-containing protein [Bacteroidales bacterium]
MKKTCLIITLVLLVFGRPAYAQNESDTIVYLLTCNPGTEMYSMYGHSALRIVDGYSETDMVYDWGVFDANTPNFVWKFAKGRLNYTLQSSTVNNFLQTYSYEERGVISQRINLNPEDIRKLLELIEENLKPENVSYRYNFFYDNCATRIRDILEKATDGKIHYPSGIDTDMRTFRDMTKEYQKPYLWLNFGINLMLGLPCDKKVSFVEKMFLPFELQQCLSKTVIHTDGRIVPLLQNPEIMIDYNMPAVKSKTLLSPEIVIALFFILIIISMPVIRKNTYINSVDIFIFSVFSILAGLMLFFNFFTDHQATRMNLNAVWLNPFIILCLISLLTNKAGVIWFRFVFFISVLFLVVLIIVPQEFSRAAVPACFILAFRSSARSAFEWNPFSINNEKN